MTHLPIENHDSAPTVPLTEVQKARASELAAALEAARPQGYIEASALLEMLDLARELIGAALKA